MGVAGSGKSVQGKLLAEELNYQWVSTGDLLRKNLIRNHQDEMLKGKLLNDDEIIKVISDFLASASPSECILDGFPRTLPQAKWLLSQKVPGDHITAVLHLQADVDVVKKRLLERGRPDDNEEAINQRFKEYRNQTLPIVGLMAEHGVPVYTINAQQSVEQVHEEILGKLLVKA